MLDAPAAWQTVLSSFTPVSQLHPSRLVWAQDQLTSLLRHRAPVPLTWSPARPITLFFRRTKTSLLLFLLFYFSSIDDLGFPGGTSGKEPACQCRRQKRPAFDPWVGKIPWREGHGNPLQYSCLENSMDRGAWRAIVHGISKSGT